MVVDTLFLVACVITWFGYGSQIVMLLRTHSVQSFSRNWLITGTLTIGMVLPRAFTSGLWVWWFGSSVSFIMSLIIVLLYFHYKGKVKVSHEVTQ